MIVDPLMLARTLGGEAHGNRVYVPGPGHSPRDRSLSILVDPNAPDGFVVYSHAGDDPIACRDYVKDRCGIRFDRPQQPARPSIFRPDTTDVDRTVYAMSIWNQAGDPPPDGPMAAYLQHRGVADVLPDGCLGGALRWHPSGFMVALVRDVMTNEPKAIHRTWINPAGERVGERKMLGPVSGGAVMLTDPADVTLALGIGEGIESTLSLRKIPECGAVAVWALLSAGQVERFPVLEGIETLWLAADHDDAGLRAVDTTAERWLHAGREVFEVKATRRAADLNDVIQEDRLHA